MSAASRTQTKPLLGDMGDPNPSFADSLIMRLLAVVGFVMWSPLILLIYLGKACRKIGSLASLALRMLLSIPRRY